MKELPNLQNLYPSLTHITDTGIAELRQSLPDSIIKQQHRRRLCYGKDSSFVVCCARLSRITLNATGSRTTAD